MLSKKEFLYYKIIYVLWRLATYYADIFCYAVPEDLFGMHTQLAHINGLTFIRIYLPTSRNLHSSYSADEMKEILQEYLNYVLMPESGISPYCGGNSVYDIVESLYIDYAGIDPCKKEGMLFNVLYIDNKISFDYYKSHYKIKQI